jgi:hypothetical protein
VTSAQSLNSALNPAMRTPTPPGGTVNPLAGARPYTPTYTPSTIASAASEVIVRPPEPMRPESVRNALILAIAGLVVFISVGVVAVLKKPWVKTPAAAPKIVEVAAKPAPETKPAVEAKPAADVKPVMPAMRAQPAQQKVVVRSEPQGAMVTVEGRPMGPTPALLTLSLPQEVFLSMKGYRTAREVLSSPGEITVRLQSEAKRATAVKVKSVEKARSVDKPAEKKDDKPSTHFKEGLD